MDTALGKEIFAKKKEIDEQMREYVNLSLSYFEVFKKQYPLHLVLRDSDDNGELPYIDLSNEGIVYHCEYNKACNCHPEYWNTDVLIMWEQLEKTAEEYAAELVQRAEAEKKREEEETHRKEAENNERRYREQRQLYLSLSKKYGSISERGLEK